MLVGYVLGHYFIYMHQRLFNLLRTVGSISHGLSMPAIREKPGALR
jgi:hypothetical protein